MKIPLLAKYLVLFLLLITGCSNNTTKQGNYSTEDHQVSLNKLVDAYWVNVGTWVMIVCDPVNDDDPERGMIGELSFDKDMHRGTEKAKVVDDFLGKVHDKYQKGIYVTTYRKGKDSFGLNYSDKTSIIWDKKTNNFTLLEK